MKGLPVLVQQVSTDNMTTTKTYAPTSSTQRVLDAVQELQRLEQVATRETVEELTGLTLTVVDDRLKALTDDGMLKRLIRGIYVPATTYPVARPITITEIPDGWLNVEVGETVLVLTPREARMLGRGLAGHVDDFRAVESIKQSMFVSTELASSVQSLKRQVMELQRRSPV